MNLRSLLRIRKRLETVVEIDGVPLDDEHRRLMIALVTRLINAAPEEVAFLREALGAFMTEVDANSKMFGAWLKGVPLNKDTKRFVDLLFLEALRNAWLTTENKHFPRAHGAKGGRSGAITKRAEVDAQRNEVARIAKEILDKRKKKLSQRALAVEIRKRWPDTAAAPSESSIRRRVAELLCDDKISLLR